MYQFVLCEIIQGYHAIAAKIECPDMDFAMFIKDFLQERGYTGHWFIEDGTTGELLDEG